MTESSPAIACDFSKTIDVAEIKSVASRYDLTAAPAECIDIAKRLGVLAVNAASGILIVKRHGGAILIEGELKASLMRECVVSLEPMEETVTDEFLIRLYAQEEDVAETDETDDNSYTDLLDGDIIHLGEELIQQISLAMHPHPRKADSSDLLSRYGREDLPSPFAALKQISTRRDD